MTAGSWCGGGDVCLFRGCGPPGRSHVDGGRCLAALGGPYGCQRCCVVFGVSFCSFLCVIKGMMIAGHTGLLWPFFSSCCRFSNTALSVVYDSFVPYTLGRTTRDRRERGAKADRDRRCIFRFILRTTAHCWTREPVHAACLLDMLPSTTGFCWLLI